MDYKNILEGTRPFFQGLPLPQSSPLPPTSASSVPLPLSSPLASRPSSRDRDLPHHHHLLNHHPHQHHHNHSQHHFHNHTSQTSQNSQSTPNRPGSGSGSSSSGVGVNNNNNILKEPPSSVITGHTGGSGRSGSLERLHFHNHMHRTGSSPSLHHPHHHMNHSHSGSNASNLPLVLPQDGEALIRSKFAEGLGATLSQMYTGGQSGTYSSTLNLSRTNHLPPAPTSGILIPTTVLSGQGQTPISDRQTIIHSTNSVSSNSGSGTNSTSVSTSAPSTNNNSPKKSNMVGVRRESPLDLSVKTVRQSADSSTSSLIIEQPLAPNNINSVGINGRSSSGASTPTITQQANGINSSVVQSSTKDSRDSRDFKDGSRDPSNSVIAAMANSTTNLERGRSREKDRTSNSTPTAPRYPSPLQHRQQSPSSSSLSSLSSLPLAPMHQRVANLNLGIPTPTPPPPPRTGSGSSVASANSGLHGQVQQQQQPQPQPNSNHHLLSHYPQASPGRLSSTATPQPQAQTAGHNLAPTGTSGAGSGTYHPHYGILQSSASLQGSQSTTPVPTTPNSNALSHPSRPSSVIPPYNPPLGAGLPPNYHPGHHPTSPYSHQLPTYQHQHHNQHQQYHPHFQVQQGQAVGQMHHAYYPSYPHIPQQVQPSTNQKLPQSTPISSAPSIPSIPAYAPQQQSKLSHPAHPSYVPQPQAQPQPQPPSHSQPTTGLPQASPYSYPYYGPPQAGTPQSHQQSTSARDSSNSRDSRPGVQTPHPQAQQHPYPYGNHPQQQPQQPPSPATPYPHYSHISYPTYLPQSQRTPSAVTIPNPQPSTPYPGQSSLSNPNFQPHPGLRPTTPTGPPPPLPGQYSSQSQYPSSSSNSNDTKSISIPPPTPTQAANSHPNPRQTSPHALPPNQIHMKPPDTPSPLHIPKVKGSSRKNVLNMLRSSVESRMHEKQEKEKFQFNHQTWNFHGRKFNTTLPPLNSTNPTQNSNSNSTLNQQFGTGPSPSLGSQGTGGGGSGPSSSYSSPANQFSRTYSKYECSSLGDLNQYGSNTSINNSGGSIGSASSGPGSGSNSNLNNININDPLHRIRTKAEKKQLFPNLLSQIEQENEHKEAERMLQNSHIFNRSDPNSTSVFDFNEEDDFSPKISIPQPPQTTALKKPRSPKKIDGPRRNSLPKKSKNSDLLNQTDDKTFLIPFSEGVQATKAVTKLAAEGSIDAFWAACDSFLDDLQSNPNSIKSRRGGLWQKLKSKTKPVPKDPKDSTNSTDATAPTPSPTKASRVARIKKNSSDEDSDFQVEKSEEEEEEEDSNSENESGSGDSSDSEYSRSGRSRSRSASLKKEKKSKRMVIDSENSEEKSDEEGSLSRSDSNSKQTKRKSDHVKKSARTRNNKKSPKAKGDDDDLSDDSKSDLDSDAELQKKGSRKGSSRGRKSLKSRTKSQQSRTKSSRRRSTRKRKTVLRSGSNSKSLDDEEATSRTSIGSESESDNSNSNSESGSGSDRYSLSDSDSNSDRSSDSDSDSDSQNSLSSSGATKRKKGDSLGGLKAKRQKRKSEKNSKSLRRRSGRHGGSGGRKKSWRKSTRSNSKNGEKVKSIGRRTRSGSVKEDDDDDENFEPKINVKSRGKGRKRKLPKRNCAPVPGNGKLKDISGESGEEGVGGGSSGEEWIMRGDLTKKKRKIVFGDGSDFKKPGWEEELLDFKRKLRMPHKLIKVSKPSSMTMSPASSIGDKDKSLNNFPTSGLAAPNQNQLIKEELSPAKSAKENKIPGPLAKKPGKKSPEKSKDLLKDLKEDIELAPATTPKKVKGRPPKSANTSTEETPPKKKKDEKPLPKSKKNKLLSIDKVERVERVETMSASRSESPLDLDDPTIEKAVERMKAAANATNKRNKLTNLAKEKDLKIKTTATNGDFKTNKKTKNDKLEKNLLQSGPGGKNSSMKKGKSKKNICDDMPILPSEVDVEMDPNSSESMTDTAKVAPSAPVIGQTTPVTVKKGFRRNKFKSGFDYIRKKKKIATNPDGSPIPPPPKRVKTLIEKNSTVEDIGVEIRGWVLNKGHGETYLHRAARLGYPDVAAYCLEHELCPANCKDNAGYTPLHETCIKGNLEVAKVLLTYGADPSQSAPGGIRPLHEACENGHVELVRLLISFGADPTLTTYAGQSPLELTEPHATVRLLLDQHINDVLGAKEKPWEFKGSGNWAEDPTEQGFDVTADPPLGDKVEEESDFDGFEFEASEIPLPPLYKLKEKTPYYVLLTDVLNYLGVPRERFLKSNPSAETVELNSNDFLEEAHCCHLLGEKFNLNSSSDLLTLIKYDDRIKKMLNIESCFIK